MPPPEHVLNKAIEALQQVQLESFAATPPSLGPFGQAELRWSVKAPAGVSFKLDGRAVPRQGSQVVRPTETRTFKLTAHAPGVSSLVGQLVLPVDLGACTTLFITEAEVQAKVLEVVDRMLAESPQVSNRSAPVIDVTPQGIVLRLRFVVEVEDARNPDFDIDALIGLGIDDQGLVTFFKEFRADLDFSFWEDVLHFTIGAFVGGPFLHLAIAISESNAQDKARRDILDGVRAAFDGFLALLPAGWAPHQLDLREDGMELRVCPRPGRSAIDSFRHAGFLLKASTLGPGRRPKRAEPKPRGTRTGPKKSPRRRREHKRW